MRYQVCDYTVLDASRRHAVARAPLAPNAPLHKRLITVLDELIREDHFELEPETGAINVGITIRPEVFAEFESSFYDKPEVSEYVKSNPLYREGRDLAYTYPWSFRNALSTVVRIAQHSCRNYYPRLYSLSQPVWLLVERCRQGRTKRE